MEYNTVVLKKYNQLVNNVYGRSVTTQGITITKDQDGSYIVSGTTTANNYGGVWIVSNIPNVAGHKYFLKGCPVGGSYGTYWLYNEEYNINYDSGNGVIWTSNRNQSTYILFSFTAGQTFDNLKIRPNFVDLTAIYGAGNEPTTVEQFLTDYPEFNGYVEYKENGYFEKEYDTLVGKISKNLIDFPSRSSQGPATILAFQNIPTGKILTLSATLSPQGGNARVRADWQESGSTHYEFGNAISPGVDGVSKVSFIIPSIVSSVNIMMQHLSGGMTVAYKDVQLEEGSTATEYEPYGWIEKEYNALTLKKYNQLSKWGDFSDAARWYESVPNTLTIANNVAKYTGIGGVGNRITDALGQHKISGNKYYLSVKAKPSINCNCRIAYASDTVEYIDKNIIANEWSLVNGIIQADSSSENTRGWLFIAEQQQVTIEYKELMIVDLTAIYGVGNEPTTVQKFLEDNPQYNDYVPYSEGGWM